MSDGGRRAKTKALKVALGDIKAAYNEGRAAGLEEARHTHIRRLMMSLRDAPLGLLKAALVVAEVAMENDGAVDGETLQGYAAIRALKEKPNDA